MHGVISLHQSSPPQKKRLENMSDNSSIHLLDTTMSGPRQRPHTKSRRGCRSCKTRRIKCDESRPLCGNCLKHFPGIERCEWDEPTPRRSRRSGTRNSDQGTSPTSMTVSLSPHPSGCSDKPAARLSEMRLLHHFTVFTCVTLPLSPVPGVAEMWAVETPQIAFGCDYLLSALLSTAALHKCLASKDADSLTSAVYYFGRALEQHRAAVATLSRLNAVPLVLCSWLINLQASQLTRGLSNASQFTLPLCFVTLRKAAAVLLAAAKPYLADSSVQAYINCHPPSSVEEVALPSCSVGMLLEDLESRSYDHYCGHSIKNSARGTLNSEKQLSNPIFLVFHQKKQCIEGHDYSQARRHMTNNALLAKDHKRSGFYYLLRDLNVNDPNCSEYSEYIQLLNTTLRAMQTGEPKHFVRSRISSMPTRTPNAFVQLMERKDPRAMAMMAHHFALLHTVSDIWWLQGTAQYNYQGIAKMMPAGWDWAMQWPAKVMSIPI